MYPFQISRESVNYNITYLSIWWWHVGDKDGIGGDQFRTFAAFCRPNEAKFSRCNGYWSSPIRWSEVRCRVRTPKRRTWRFRDGIMLIYAHLNIGGSWEYVYWTIWWCAAKLCFFTEYVFVQTVWFGLNIRTFFINYNFKLANNLMNKKEHMVFTVKDVIVIILQRT